jgi:hypothetical protein
MDDMLKALMGSFEGMDKVQPQAERNSKKYIQKVARSENNAS